MLSFINIVIFYYSGFDLKIYGFQLGVFITLFLFIRHTFPVIHSSLRMLKGP